MQKFFAFTLLAAVAFSGAGISTSVFAQQQPPAPQRLNETDTDGDGAVSREEFMKQAQLRFNVADINHDDKITQDEFEKLRQKLMQAQPSRPSAPVRN